VSGTRESGIPTTKPATIARTIQPWCTTSGWAHVTTMAIVIAATAEYTPFRAVAGAFIQCSARMNRTVAMRYAS